MAASSEKTRRSPWFWVPSLYFAEGIPYIVVMTVSVIMYKRLGISNTDIALYTSWLYLPWVIKPLWSPLVDLLKTKRLWIVAMQLLIGAGLAGVALTIPAPDFFRYTLAFLWLLAFSSATHDIAADGFYMLGLSQHDQAWFVGVRSTFYRIAMITGQGLLIILAGAIESGTGLPTVSLGVEAQPGATEVTLPPPEAIEITERDGPLRIEMMPGTLTIPVAGQPQARVDSVLGAAQAWNRSHGFYSVAETTAEPPVPGGVEEAGLSWWDRTIRMPVERNIQAWFGEVVTEAPPGEAGNVGVAYFTLSGRVPEGETIVVNLGRTSGDDSVLLLEGERFVFTPQNWDQPVVVVFQLDRKLDEATSATFDARSGNIPLAWSITFYVLAGMFVFFFVYHQVVLPRPASDRPKVQETAGDVLRGFLETFASFFRKRHILVILGFLLFFRFAEAQLVKLASPFLLDARAVGGLALTTGEVGFVYGTIGIVMLTIGGLVGGFVAARDGLKRWLWWMVIAINIPNAVYIFLAYAMPTSYFVVNIAVGVEQFGYGFGFTAYLLYMIYVSEGEHKTAHYAICTGFMALGMMVPGMFSGWLQELIGYQHFFVWVLLATAPSFLMAYLIPLDPEFGKKDETEEAEPA